MNTGHHDPDEGRRVLQCARCDRTRAWTGREDAIVAGWGSRWENEQRVWECPEHFTPAPPVEPGPPNLALPDSVSFAACSRLPSERAKLRADLARMLDVDAERAQAWAKAILAKVGKDKGRAAKEWRAWAQEHRTALNEPAKKRARARRAAA